MNKKGLMLDDKKSKGKKDPHTAKWKRCFEKVSKEKGDESAAAICTDSIGYEGSIKKSSQQKESIDENQIINIIKKEENPRMSKKQLVEYVKNKTKKVVKKVTKDELVNEARSYGRDFDPNKWPDFNEGGIKKTLMQYIEALRRSGVINMFGSYPILNWTREDLERWLYGRGKDLESLEYEMESEYEGEDWDGEFDDSEPETRDDIVTEQYRMVKYLLENKDKIRDILIRVALKRADRLGGDHSRDRIQRLFQEAAKDAWIIFTQVR